MYTRNGPTFQLPNNTTVNATKTEILPLSRGLSTQGKKAHIFYGLHIASLISLEKLCDKDCISIIDKNEINIIKYKTLILKGHVNNTDGLCYIPISRSLRDHAHAIITIDKTKTELIQYLHG